MKIEFGNTEYYNLNECVSFLKTDEVPFGGLSNMAAKRFPLMVNGLRIDNSESLYQACRFPDHPDVQMKIVENKSPMGAKMTAKSYKNDFTRDDFEIVKIEIMYWCLKVKLACNPNSFGGLLEKTGQLNIVEISRRDRFWGTTLDKDDFNKAKGQNVLGKLLMELRSFYRENKNTEKIYIVEPLPIENFRFNGMPIKTIRNSIFLKDRVF